MKKLIAIVLIILVMFSSASAGSLRMAQDYVYSFAPKNGMDFDFTIEGIVCEVYKAHNGDFRIRVEVEDSDAFVSIDYDKPCFVASFAYLMDKIQLNVGDTVKINGNANLFYSTVMVPFLVVNEVNDMEIYDWLKTFEE